MKLDKKRGALLLMLLIALPLLGYYFGTLKPPNTEYVDRTEYVIDPEITEILERIELKTDTLLLDLGKVLSFTRNQEAFNTQLMKFLENLEITENTTTIYEIHNETLIEVENTYIENATFLYTIEEMTIDEVNIDIDLYVQGSMHHNNFYIKCHPGFDD